MTRHSSSLASSQVSSQASVAPLAAVAGVALALTFVGCSGSTGASTSNVSPDTALRIPSAETRGGEGDGLAAAVLMSTPLQGFRPDRPQIAMTDTALRDQLQELARTHLLQDAGGSSLEGSAFIRRLAQANGAPQDTNGNGSNLDETLAVQLARFAELAGSVVTPTAVPSLFSWATGSADFADASRSARTENGAGDVSLEQVGRTMLARTLLATALLQRNRGSRAGATPEDGVLGLTLLQQVIAAEETIFSNLFTQGRALGNLPFPSDYQPEGSVFQWVPAVVAATGSASEPRRTEAYRLVDPASRLSAVAALMRAAAELSFYAGASNPNPNLRDVFRGHPFGQRPGGGPGNGNTDGPSSEIVTWENGVAKLFTLWCSGCHEKGNFPGGNLVLDSYETVQEGSDNTAPITSEWNGTGKPPIIVRGDPERSVLFKILTETPPPGFDRMPEGGPVYMGETELEIVRSWIRDGARSAPPGPPVIGVDLAVVLFKNLVAVHLDRREKTAGALFIRDDGDADPIQYVDVAATGETLQALAAMAHLKDQLTARIGTEDIDYDRVLRSIVAFALEHLSNTEGEVVTGFDLAKMQPEGTGDLHAHARLTAGMLAVARILNSPELNARAAVLAKRLIENFFDPSSGLFDSRLDRPGRSYTPVVIAAVVDALREAAHDSIDRAVETQQVFLARLLPVLVFSETEATGEVLGDGNPDTDGDGILEPAAAGGPFGRAPLFVGQIQEGANPVFEVQPLLWTKHIRPLFEQKCSQCHLRGADRGGYRLDTPTSLRMPGTFNPGIPLVVPGDPEGSYLYRKLIDRIPASGKQMPEDLPPLAPHGIALVRQWILEGATAR